MKRLLACLLILLLAAPAIAAVPGVFNQFWLFITQSPTATGPYSSSDYIPLIRGGQTFRTAASNFSPPTGATLPSLTLTGDGTTGIIYPPTGVLHESQGGVLELASNVLMIGDYAWLRSADISLYTLAAVTVGTPTAGEIPGIRFTIGSTNYDFTYNTQPGDGAAQVTLGICNAIVAGYNADTNGFKTALNATLDGQSQGMGNPIQTTCAGQIMGAGPYLYFDQPYIGGTTASGLSSANYAVALVSAQNGFGTPKMDGGPVFNCTRNYPVGYVLSVGDLGCYYNFQTRVGLAGYQQSAYFESLYGNTGWTVQLGPAGGAALAVREDSIAIDHPLVLGGTTTITGPSVATASNLAVVTGGAAGVQFNANNNSDYTFKVDNSANATAHGTLAVGGTILSGGRKFSAHLATNQNISMFSSGGVANLEALNDAAGAYVPLDIASSLTTFTSHIATSGTAPALTSCGTSPAIAGTDTAGTVTMGTGTPTGCVITFNTAYTTAPHCTVTWRATPLASQSYAVSTTAITLTQTATDSNVVDYICVAPAGG